MNIYSPPEPARYRAIFISDVHMGTRRAQVAALLDFLRATESDWLYVVSDLIDNWALGKRWHWDQLHNDLIQKLLRKARKGTKLIYIPGNHDEQFRDFVNLRLGRVSVLEDPVHLGANGKRYLVLHGDKFDGIVCYAAWLAKLLVPSGRTTIPLPFYPSIQLSLVTAHGIGREMAGVTTSRAPFRLQQAPPPSS